LVVGQQSQFWSEAESAAQPLCFYAQQAHVYVERNADRWPTALTTIVIQHSASIPEGRDGLLNPVNRCRSGTFATQRQLSRWLTALFSDLNPKGSLLLQRLQHHRRLIERSLINGEMIQIGIGDHTLGLLTVPEVISVR
tara:strand:- start:1228 stop:1644 length:417 start_codon:yes stop_codon:yes gene_type:complete